MIIVIYVLGLCVIKLILKNKVIFNILIYLIETVLIYLGGYLKSDI